MSDCNVATLLSDGKCFKTLSIDQQMAVMLQLLCDINTAMAGIGGLSDVTWYFDTATSTGTPVPLAADEALRWGYVQADESNSNDCYIGVGATGCYIKLVPGQGCVLPCIQGAQFNLNEWYLDGDSHNATVQIYWAL